MTITEIFPSILRLRQVRSDPIRPIRSHGLRLATRHRVSRNGPSPRGILLRQVDLGHPTPIQQYMGQNRAAHGDTGDFMEREPAQYLFVEEKDKRQRHQQI